MILTINQGYAGKKIAKLVSLNNEEEKAEVLREIQETFPRLLYKRLRQKLLQVGLINQETVIKTGLKPVGYK